MGNAAVEAINEAQWKAAQSSINKQINTAIDNIWGDGSESDIDAQMAKTGAQATANIRAQGLATLDRENAVTEQALEDRLVSMPDLSLAASVAATNGAGDLPQGSVSVGPLEQISWDGDPGYAVRKAYRDAYYNYYSDPRTTVSPAEAAQVEAINNQMVSDYQAEKAQLAFYDTLDRENSAVVSGLSLMGPVGGALGVAAAASPWVAGALSIYNGYEGSQSIKDGHPIWGAVQIGTGIFGAIGAVPGIARSAADLFDGLAASSFGSAAAQAGKLDINAFYASQDAGYVSQATLISEARTFTPLGVDRVTVNDYLSTQEGQNFMQALWAADPNVPNADLYARAMDQITTGVELPEMQITTSPLVKIVPEGSGVNDYTPFFTTQEQVDNIPPGLTLADYFGLPLKSEAPVYSMYQVTATQPAGVFVNRVAPTVELDGLIQRSGGATQYLVPNRSLWTDPVFIGTRSN